MMTRDTNEELEQLLEADPVKNHERIMQMIQPAVVYKDYIGRQPSLTDDTNGNGEQPLFSDEQIDTIAQAMADLRSDMRSEFQNMVADAVGSLTEQVAVLQGQVGVLINMISSIIGNNNSNSVKEASETKTKTVRRVRQIESKPR